MSAGSQPEPAGPSPTLTATAGSPPDDSQVASPARLPTGPPPALASKPGPARVARGGPYEKAPVARPRYLTARELIDTRIAILNGNGVHYQAHDTRSQLSQEGFTVSAIGNFRDFGVERTVIYYHPDAKQVAAVLNQKFFPMAEVEAAPQMAGKVDVKVVLGRDLRPQQYAGAYKAPGDKPL